MKWSKRKIEGESPNEPHVKKTEQDVGSSHVSLDNATMTLEEDTVDEHSSLARNDPPH